MRQELFFVGSSDSDGRGVGRSVFDPLAVDIYVHQFADPIGSLAPSAARSAPALRATSSGNDFDVTDVPASIVHEEILDMTDLAVAGVDMVPGDSRDAAEIGRSESQIRSPETRTPYTTYASQSPLSLLL